MAPTRNGRVRRTATAQSNEDRIESDNEEPQAGREERVQNQKTKTKKTGRASRVGVETEQREEVAPPPIDILNFTNQPLSKSDGAKIGQIAGDWQKVRGNVRESAIALVKEIGEAMAEAGMGEDDDSSVSLIYMSTKDYLAEYCIIGTKGIGKNRNRYERSSRHAS